MGFDVKTAQALARHKTADMTMNVYGRASAERMRGAVETLGKAIEAAKTARIIQIDDKRQPLPLAAGAEGMTYPRGVHGDSQSREMVGATGLEPVTPWV